MSGIVLERVTKRFGGTVAVNDISLEIGASELFSFVGPSGCGKTTILRMIAGLERPDSGRIWLGGKLVASGESLEFVQPQHRGLGMVFQSYALWPHMTVFENIAFGLRARKHTPPEVKKMAEDILEVMQIPALGERYPSELSGGQQQRVALAREFVTGARILLMDEPLSNLDARLRMDMRSELKRLQRETGVTLMYVTHDQLEALTLSSRIAVMRDGAIQQLGTPDEVFFQPKTLFVSEFIGLNPINVVRFGEVRQAGEPNGQTLRGLLSRMPRFPLGARGVVVGLRPEFLSCSQTPRDWSAEAVVDTVLSAGPVDFIQVSFEDPLGRIQLMIQEGTKARFDVGQRIQVVVDPDRTLFFDATTLDSLA